MLIFSVHMLNISFFMRLNEWHNTRGYTNIDYRTQPKLSLTFTQNVQYSRVKLFQRKRELTGCVLHLLPRGGTDRWDINVQSCLEDAHFSISIGWSNFSHITQHCVYISLSLLQHHCEKPNRSSGKGSSFGTLFPPKRLLFYVMNCKQNFLVWSLLPFGNNMSYFFSFTV